MINNGDTEGARQYLNDKILPKTAEVIDILSKMQLRYAVLTEEKDVETTRVENLVFRINMALIIIALITGAFFAIFIANLISKPLAHLTAFLEQANRSGNLSLPPEKIDQLHSYLGEIQRRDRTSHCCVHLFFERVSMVARTLENIADGDLTAELSMLSDKDTLGLSLNKMLDNLNRMFGNINFSSSQVSSGAIQVADGAQALATGATQQAVSIEELSGSISRISAMAKENTQALPVP